VTYGAIPDGPGLLPSALLPPVVNEATAAFLVIDLCLGEVTYANQLAREMVPGVELPISLDEWSAAAGLEDLTGSDLPVDSAPPSEVGSRSLSLLRVAHGEPVLGEAVTAARATTANPSREPLWVIGLPMTDAPEPISSLALVAFMPLRNARLVAGVQESASLLRDRAVLATRVSFTISDPTQPDNPLVWVNPAFTATTGYSFDDVVGKNCRFLQGPRTDRRTVADLRRGLDDNLPITTTLLNYRKDGTTFWNELSISPVLDRDGHVTHFVGVQADVTARVDAQHARDAALADSEVAAGRLSLLADFARRLTGSLEGEDILEVLADTVVPHMATWCAIHLIEEDDSTRSIVRHERSADPEVAVLIERLEEVLLDPAPKQAPSARILRGEVPFVLVDDMAGSAESSLSGDERSNLARALGTSSLVSVPLRSRHRIVGAMTLVVDGTRRPFGPDDVSLAQDLGARAALMLENSMLYTHERTAAVALQRSLMPRIPAVGGLTIAAEYLTATDQAAVGGDWYDVFALRDGAVGIAIGDAMGHNFDSAAAMGKLSTMLRAYAWPGAEPADVLDAVDALLAGTKLPYLATCVYGTLHLDEGGALFHYASAGHPPPIMRAPDGTAVPLDRGRGAMLGVSGLMTDGGQRFGESLHLARGTTLLFFTDGLTDSMGEDLDVVAAAQRLADITAAQPLDASPSALVAALVAETRAGRKDDVAVVALGID
jgi:PAS domain S-box-containing protein